MPQPLPSPYIPSALPVLEAFRTGQADRLAEQQRGALQQAGKLASEGSLAGARKHLLEQGMFKEAEGIQGMIRQASDDQLAKVKRSQEVLGNLAMTADTPEKWAVAVQMAQRSGMDVSKYTDFGSRELILAQTGKVNELLDYELKNRALSMKEAGGGQKAPAGYRWKPDGTLEPIPGGPATRVSTAQIPAELGARIGLGDQFLSEKADIESKVKQIDTGDRVNLAIGRGNVMDIWRRIETGREALVRNLTGAGMAQSEAENMAARYQINATDKIDTMVKKLEGLENDLKAVRQGALSGKGGQMSPMPPDPAAAQPQQAPAANDDPLGILGP